MGTFLFCKFPFFPSTDTALLGWWLILNTQINYALNHLENRLGHGSSGPMMDKHPAFKVQKPHVISMPAPWVVRCQSEVTFPPEKPGWAVSEHLINYRSIVTQSNPHSCKLLYIRNTVTMLAGYCSSSFIKPQNQPFTHNTCPPEALTSLFTGMVINNA